MFYPKDTRVYTESYDITTAAAVSKGEPAQLRDVFGFYMISALINTLITFVYKMQQVEADKATGSGEAILALERVYYVVATGLVTAHPVGNFGVDYYYCGIAKFDASESAETVIIDFDGTRWDEDV